MFGNGSGTLHEDAFLLTFLYIEKHICADSRKFDLGDQLQDFAMPLRNSTFVAPEPLQSRVFTAPKLLQSFFAGPRPATKD